jgi:tetratricopeptide (TPR) repeat protein
MIDQIKIDQTRCKHLNDEILFEIFRIDRLNNLNSRFLYFQVFIDVLLQMDSMSNDMIDLISLCRDQYKGNKFQLNILREFQQTYSSNNAIWWFTRDTIISRLLNKALRIQNIDLIFLFRFFLHDIEQQLKENQCLSPIKVYRYQLMSERELQLLKNSIGQFISINNFLITNTNRNSTLSVSKISLTKNTYQPVLFEITANPNLDKIKPFANITSQNYSPSDQNQVLFMLGSIFQLDNIHQDDNNLWIIEITLSSKTNKHLKSIFDNDDDDDISLLSFGYILQKMNKLDETEKYYRRLLDELPDDDERIGCCYLNLGNIAFIKTDYNSSLEWLLKSLDISIRTLQPNDIFLAFIYNSMGHVYNAKHDSTAALESYNNAICMWKQNIDDTYLNIAECMNNIGIIYKQEKHYLLA